MTFFNQVNTTACFHVHTAVSIGGADVFLVLAYWEFSHSGSSRD